MQNDPLLLEVEQLRPQLDDPRLLIIDLCQTSTYAQGHIPSAIHLPPSALQCGIPPAVGKLPTAERLSALFSQLGVTPNHHIVVYDDEGGGWAGRLLWTLDILGHTAASYLNGGIHAWLAANYPLDTKPTSPEPTPYTATINPEPIATLDTVRASLDNPHVALWDARSAEEYEGSKILSQRGGHIPGAININCLELIDQQRQTRLIDSNDLTQRLQTAGLTKDKTIITYCQTHHRSALAYLALKILGFDAIKGYDGSWAEWGNRDDTPIDGDK